MQDAQIRQYTGQGETILAIEADELMLDLINEILTINGYRVHLVRNTREAKHCYDKRSQEIQLILADLWLTGLSDMLAQILRPHPSISIVLTSYQPLKNRYFGHIGLSILEKPFDIADLLFAVRVALDGDTIPWSKSYLN